MKTWQPTNAQLVCRDLQHMWTPRTAKRIHRGFIRTLECLRCSTMKDQTLDEFGYIVSTRMSYPTGYLRRDEGRLTRDDRAELRLRNITS